MGANRGVQDCITCLGRAVLDFHAQTEQKRVKGLEKERLKALKVDDEEAYMKLFNTVKYARTQPHGVALS